MEKITDIYRNFIVQNSKLNLGNFSNGNLVLQLPFYLQNIPPLSKNIKKISKEEREMQSFYRGYLEIIFMDYYKETLFHLRNNDLSIEERQSLDCLSGILSFEDVLKAVENFELLPRRMAPSSYRFKCSPELQKIRIVKCLTNSDKNFLSREFPFFQEDLQSYDGPVTLQKYLEHFKQMLATYTQDFTIFENKFYPIEEVITEEIVAFIKELYIMDRSNYYDNLRGFIWEDYLLSKFLLHFSLADEGLQAAQQRIIWFEEQPEAFLQEQALQDPNYLIEMVSTYFTKEMSPEVKANEDLHKTYVYALSNENVRNKLRQFENSRYK